MFTINARAITVIWLPFLISPFFTTNILQAHIGTDLLAFATALAAAALMNNNTPSTNKPLHPSWFFLFLLLFPALIAFSMGELRNPWGTFRYCLYFIATWAIYRMAQGSVADLFSSRHWIATLGIVGNIYVLIMLAQSFHLFTEDQSSLFAIWTYISSFSGPLLQRNFTSLLLNLIVASLLVQYLREKLSIGWLLAAILPCANIIASGSRSGLGILIIVFIVLLIADSQRIKFAWRAILAFAFASSIAYAWHLASITPAIDVISRISGMGISYRLMLWNASLEIFINHPWFGIGYGNLASFHADAAAVTLSNHPNLPSMSMAIPWSHNIILQFLAEGGLFGAIALTALFLTIALKLNRTWQMPDRIQQPQFLGGLGVIILLTQGMVGISIFQGFFLSLLGLFLAALFASKSQPSSAKQVTPSYILYFLPAIYFFFLWFQFVSMQVDIRKVFDDPPESPRFIKAVAPAIDNPWLSYNGLQYYFSNMYLSNAPVYQWVNSEHLIHYQWRLSQDPISLRQLILLAHLTNNTLSEKRWVKLYTQAYKDDPWVESAMRHIKTGHQLGEPIDLWH